MLKIVVVQVLLVGLTFAGSKLTLDDARDLLSNAPDFIQPKTRGACPSMQLLWTSETYAVFQIRSHCPKGVSELIGNYTVDLEAVEVWEGVDRNRLLRSDRLRRTQQRLRRKLGK